MTQVVHLEASTRRQRRAWSAVAFGALAVAILLAVLAGGSTAWLRMALGAVAIVGCREAIRLRRSLGPMVVAAAIMLAVVPIDARLDRTFVAAAGAVLLLATAECVHVARRLATAVPVTSTRPEARSVAMMTAAALSATALTVVVAQVDRWSTAWFAGGLVMVAAVLAWQAPTDPPATQPGQADSTGWSGSRP